MKQAILKDLTPSFVLLLVALPLSMGIAIASGASPANGLITAIIGGIVVGIFGGAHLQIAGPSAGLAVLVAEMIGAHGLETFTLIVVIAGILQFIAGSFKFGRFFRAVAPSVIQGMLSGIGILIMASQFHVMLDQEVYESGLKNIAMIPTGFMKAFSTSEKYIPALIGIMTLLIITGWGEFKPKKLKAIPGPLLGISAATLISYFGELPIKYVSVPEQFIDIIHFPDWQLWSEVFSVDVILSGAALAFVASAETLLCANAVSRMHNGPRTKYNQELAANGVGNILCGLVGGLPLAGVISRTTVNVHSGASSRYAGILHAIWITLFVLALPQLLALIPTSSLGAILIYVGYKLFNLKAIRELIHFGIPVATIFFATLIGIVAINLLAGIIIGLVISSIKLLYMLSHIEIERRDTDARSDIILHGSATFLALPHLGHELETLNPGSHICFHLEHLDFIDHACLDLLSAFKHRHEENGGTITLEWDTLLERYTTKKGTRSSGAISVEELSDSIEELTDDS